MNSIWEGVALSSEVKRKIDDNKLTGKYLSTARDQIIHWITGGGLSETGWRMY